MRVGVSDGKSVGVQVEAAVGSFVAVDEGLGEAMTGRAVAVDVGASVGEPRMGATGVGVGVRGGGIGEVGVLGPGVGERVGTVWR